MIQRALELAVAHARREARTPGAPPPPTALRPVLKFSHLPRTALRTVRSVLDTDDEFRRRVLDGVREDDLDRGSWLFLARPEGWADELELIEAVAAEEDEGAQRRRDEQRAARRAAQLDDLVQRLRDEVSAAQAALDAAEAALDAEREARRAAEREREELAAHVEVLRDERATAVRSLKDAEAVAEDRLSALRAARSELTDATRRAESAVLGQVARDVARGRAAAVELTSSLDSIEQVLAEAVAAIPSTGDGEPPGVGAPDTGSTATAASDPGTADIEAATPDASSRSGDRRPPRRTPIRLRQGATEDSVEGVEQLLRTPGAVVVVDGYNVAMEGWPPMGAAAQRESLLAALGVVHSLTGANLHVVFDGESSGGRPSVGASLPVRVHFSPAEVEADDLILEMVAKLPTDVGVVVVSSDRRVADGARRLGANSVRSADLLAYLRR